MKKLILFLFHTNLDNLDQELFLYLPYLSSSFFSLLDLPSPAFAKLSGFYHKHKKQSKIYTDNRLNKLGLQCNFCTFKHFSYCVLLSFQIKDMFIQVVGM